MKSQSKNEQNFNEFRFAGLNYQQYSNQYLTMNRVSADEQKIVVKVGDAHILETRYGYAFILDQNHVVFLKDWNVSINWYGVEVLLDKRYFIVKEWGDFCIEFDKEPQNLSFETWLEYAKKQDAWVSNDGAKLNPVRWKI